MNLAQKQQACHQKAGLLLFQKEPFQNRGAIVLNTRRAMTRR